MPRHPEIEFLGVEKLGFEVAPGVIEGIGEGDFVLAGLTRRFKPVEFHALETAFAGYTRDETGQDRHISGGTIKVHRRNALKVLGLSGSVTGLSAMSLALRQSTKIGLLLEPEPEIKAKVKKSNRIDKIFPGELEVLILMSFGLKNPEIAVHRTTTYQTAQKQAQTIIHKTRARNRLDAVRKGFIWDLLTKDDVLPEPK